MNKKALLLIYIVSSFVLINIFTKCGEKEEILENPYVKIINSFDNYKLTSILINLKILKVPGDYLVPGDSTDLKQVDPGNLLLVYDYININNASDSSKFQKLYGAEIFPELKQNYRYKIILSGTPGDPTIQVISGI